MSKYSIAAIVGSLRTDSFNRKLANALVKLAPIEFSFQQVKISDLPLYNQDNDANPAESVKRLKNEIKSAQGLLFVTPEYNRSIPRCTQERNRPRLAPLWSKRVGGETGRGIGSVARCDGHGHGTTAFAQYSRASGYAHVGPTGRIHSCQGRVI